MKIKRLRSLDLLPLHTAPGGFERKTSKMIERDLDVARKRWLEGSKKSEEREERLKSGFLSAWDDRDSTKRT